MVGMLWLKGDSKHTAVMPRDSVAAIAEHQIPIDYNAYLSPNPTSGPSRFDKGRGNEEQVTRIAAIFADLDVKPGSCPNIDAAHELVDEISARIEERPTVVIFSGGGLQPIWVMDDCSPEVGRPLLRRFGRLVKAVGQERGIKLDSVFDAARVLRIPGSLNHKYGIPVEAVAIEDTGGPVVPATLAERLTEWGITETEEDERVGLGDVVAAETGWRYALESCGYSVTTIAGWLVEPVTERHPWLLNCLVRLECMRRNGCLTQADYTGALRKLETRFTHLCATQEPRRAPKRYEVKDVHNVAIDRAARKATGRDLDTEIGGENGHVHLSGSGPAPTLHLEPEGRPEAAAEVGIGRIVDLEQGFWESRESLETIYAAALAHMASPWAVLACCVARSLTMVPASIVLPDIIGGRGSLNWFGALAAPSGGGKGAANAVARKLVRHKAQQQGLDADDGVYERNPGSGEGLVQAFREDKGTRESIMFNANEIDSLAALGSRSGSTLMSTLRDAFSGDRLGFAYAARGKDFHVEPHTYRMTFLCSVQPGRAKAILGDADGGTPQRFMWFPAVDKRVTRESRRQFKNMNFGLELRSYVDFTKGVQSNGELLIPSEAEEFIERQHELRQQGDGTALDGHAVFAREKFAYALAVLDNRVQMNSEDWALSDIAAQVSNATREWVTEGMAEAERALATEAGELQGVKLAAADASKSEVVTRKAERIADSALSKIAEAGSDGITERDLRNSFHSRDRTFLVDVVLPQMHGQGLLDMATGPRGGRLWKLLLANI